MFLSFTYSGLSFSRSYGYILPSSLTRVFPRTLEFSSCLPVSVLVRAASSSLEAFLDNRVPVPSPVFLQAPYHFSAFRIPDLPGIQPTCLDMLFQSHANFPSCVTPSLKQTTSVQEFQPVVHRLCVSASAFGGMDSHHSFRYSYRHSHFLPVHLSFRSGFAHAGTLPYPCIYIHAKASVPYFSPGHLRRRVSRPVSYYALF